MNLTAKLRHDLPASIVVFFVAIPLCLGIALASEAPLFSGLIAGMIGGLVVGTLSGSALGVSGPAAGLVVIVLTGIDKLGSFEAFLLAVVVAGAVQIALGVARAGVLAYFFPSSVIKGMLTGIGILIILKQIPHALGHDTDPEGDFSFVQPDGDTTFSSLRAMFDDFSLSAIIVSVVSLVILLSWDTIQAKRSKVFKSLPGPLIVVLFGIAFELLTQKFATSLTLSREHLVRVPIAESFESFLALFTHPDWSQASNPLIWTTGVTIAIVASLETLLCAEAADKLDPLKRVTPTNRELVAQGAGNMISGLIGGLPITQVIVRSSANVQSGGRTKLSAILHGAFIAIFVFAFPQVLNLVPLAALASILLVVGYKLAKPSVFKQMFTLGWEQYTPFLVTIVGIVATDLLTGICLGMAVALFVILRAHFRNSHFLHIQERDGEGGQHHVTMRLAEEVTFLNKGALLKELNAIPDGSFVTIDATESLHVDHDVLEIIADVESTAERRGLVIQHLGSVSEAQGLDVHGAKLETALASQPSKLEAQEAMSAAQALELLVEGNRRFRENRKLERDFRWQVQATSVGEFPFAVVLSCIDSRAPVELIFDLGLGDVFGVRAAGNVVNDGVLGSLEFSCSTAGAKLVVVLGHTSCGAVGGACDGIQLGHWTQTLAKLQPAVASTIEPREPALRNSTNQAFVDAVARRNVELVLSSVRERSTLLRELEDSGTIKLVGAMYDLQTGRVEFDRALQPS